MTNLQINPFFDGFFLVYRNYKIAFSFNYYYYDYYHLILMENNLRKVCSATSAKINLRMKGLRATSGQILKGCVKDTATKLSIGSIPSNNENIIHNTINSKAFGRSSPRFKYTNS